jgi:hypothetical protein
VGLGEVGKGVFEGGDVAGDFCELQNRLVKLHEDGAVFGFLHHGAEEDAAAGDLVLDVVALGAAGVDHESEGEGKVGALGEVADGLRFAVLLEEEGVFGEAGDGLAGLIADDGRDGDQAGLHSEGRDVGGLPGSLRSGRRLRSEGRYEQGKQYLWDWRGKFHSSNSPTKRSEEQVKAVKSG